MIDLDLALSDLNNADSIGRRSIVTRAANKSDAAILFDVFGTQVYTPMRLENPGPGSALA